jgi:hypothetical protein
MLRRQVGPGPFVLPHQTPVHRLIPGLRPLCIRQRLLVPLGRFVCVTTRKQRRAEKDANLVAKYVLHSKSSISVAK